MVVDVVVDEEYDVFCLRVNVFVLCRECFLYCYNDESVGIGELNEVLCWYLRFVVGSEYVWFFWRLR